jgi:protein involved in polysaccharide export with SLBB domain
MKSLAKILSPSSACLPLLRRCALLLALVAALIAPLAAQDASQLLDLLRQDPSLLEKLKTVVAEQPQTADQPSTEDQSAASQTPESDENTPADDEDDPTTTIKSPLLAPRDESSSVAKYASDEPVKATSPQAGRMTGRTASNRSARNGKTPDSKAARKQRSDEEPEPRRRPLPYNDLPSVVDLYTQLPATGGKVKRFGAAVFQNGTGNSGELPMDLPAGPDYVLGPGDVLLLNLWGGHNERGERRVDRQGQITLPEAGAVMVAGLTIAQAQETIRRTLAPQFREERAEISLGRVRTVRVYVVGDVERPGAYDLSSLSTPLNALYAAGGPLPRGSLRRVRHFRGAQLIAEVDLYDFLLHGVRADTERLLPGDTLLVPPVGAEVTVTGMVRRPAIYELKGGESLAAVLEMAGGPLVSASLKQIRVERVEAHQRRTMLTAEVGKDQAAAAALATFPVQDGDQVLISPILPYNEQVVFLDGHVFRPGRYAYHPGMKLSELLGSYRDVMPEPAGRGEIIRLQPPDFRPEAFPFDLPAVLAGKETIPLEPFDVVRVRGRYEADPPLVRIRGEVLRPGSYPLTRGMTLAGLVRLAGGFQRSAYRQTADLSSYVVQNGERVRLERREVAVGRALAGEPGADVELKPGDVVGIRQLSGWQDIGASVTINGEVGFAGTYGIQAGERLSSVLRRAGGFRDGAYPEGAVLERTQVGELAEQSRQEMIKRIEASVPTLSSSLGSGQEQASQLLAVQMQRQQVLAALRSHPASSRLVVRISSRIQDWENTPADIELRADDTLFIPKRPNFVMIAGQVYNPSAVTYLPGKSAGWYLERAGGATHAGNRKDIYVLRADGSVVGHGGWLEGGALGVVLKPGDTVVVPEKVVGGPVWWRGLIGAAQFMSSVALTGSAAKLY